MKHHVHSLNSSPAKQKYSFSKASRFSTIKASYLILNIALMFHIYQLYHMIDVQRLWAMEKDLLLMTEIKQDILMLTNCPLHLILKVETH